MISQSKFWIVYDRILCSPDSFEKVKSWLAEVKQFARSEATYMIFGNKKDLATEQGQRQVSYTEGAKFAQENGKWDQQLTLP